MKQPIDIDRALFEAHFPPRFGLGNPELIDNPYWQWEIRRRLDGNDMYPSRVRRGLGIDQREQAFTPAWTFSRMGSTETVLEDGTRVFISGEYEDWYDPDFYIYNDVIVARPCGAISIFGYPREIFPPTDFHTATLVGSRVIVIGSIGYPEGRKIGGTPVYSLDLADYAIEPLASDGPAPGWIHDHEAELLPGGVIAVRGGNVYEEANGERNFWRNASAFPLRHFFLRLDTSRA